MISNRNYVVDNDNNKRLLIFEPSEDGSAVLSVFAEGLNSPEKIEIINTNIGEISSGDLVLDLEKGRKDRIVVEFSYEYDGAIEIIAVSSASTNMEARSEN